MSSTPTAASVHVGGFFRISSRSKTLMRVCPNGVGVPTIAWMYGVGRDGLLRQIRRNKIVERRSACDFKAVGEMVESFPLTAPVVVLTSQQVRSGTDEDNPIL